MEFCRRATSDMMERIMLTIAVCLLSNVVVQAAALCPVDMITKRDTGEDECVPCLKCPAGLGLSVNCGDVITPQTPIVCQSCVLGETYSPANEPGACKDCENCGEYRETIKACTLTSKAVCGKCKVGAYPHYLLPMCQPCSPCCNDGNDIVIPRCQVPGVPKSMQCSYGRSGKCGKVTAAKVLPKASFSTTSLTVPSPSTVTPSKLYPTATKVTAQRNRSNKEQRIHHRGEQVKSDGSKDSTFSESTEMVAVVVGLISVAIVAVGVALVWKFKPSIKEALAKRHRAVPGNVKMESEIPLQHLQGEDKGSEPNELQTPVELGNPLEQLQGNAEPDELQKAVVLLDKDASSPIPESGDSPEPFPVPETQQSSGLDGPDKVSPPVQNTQPPGGKDSKYHSCCKEPRANPGNEAHRHTKAAIKTTTTVKVSCDSEQKVTVICDSEHNHESMV